MARALFVCIDNAARSQMGQALFDRAARGRHAAESAGLSPASAVEPEVVEVLKEIGIDISRAVPRRLTPAMEERADVVVRIGCGDRHPAVPGTRYVDWDLDDLQGRPLADVRATRDEIARRVEGLLRELDGVDAWAR
jgi:arsenate reductase (thioredoxin)